MDEHASFGALAAQRALLAGAWNIPGALGVRMAALHTGVVEPRAGDSWACCPVASRGCSLPATAARSC